MNSTSGGERRLLSDRAIDLLRCPRCRGTLERSAAKLRCKGSCSTSYPLIDGIPILIDESRSVFRIASYGGGPKNGKIGRLERAKGWGLKHLPRLETNAGGKEALEKFCHLVKLGKKRPLVLNIGGKHAASLSTVAAHDSAIDLIEVDFSIKQRCNLIADPHSLPLPDRSVDGVIIDAVLEHVLDPFQVVEEIHRVLKEDGVVYSDTPFMIQVHGGAFDFLRFSPLAHKRIFRKFEELESGVSCGPGSATANALQYFCLSFVKSPWARLVVKGMCRVTLFWLKYFDRYLSRKPGAQDCSLGTFFLGKWSDRCADDLALLSRYPGNVPDLYPGVRPPTAP